MRSLRVWLGALLVALGVLWLLDLVGVLSAGSVVARWWPVAVIGLAVLALVGERRLAPGPVVVLLAGLALLIGQFTPVGVAQIAWILAAVVIGGWLLLTYPYRPSAVHDAAERQDVLTLMGGSHTANRSASFSHADVAAVFGGATFDLRDATPVPGARVDALAMFGGVEVIVPQGWRIELSGLPIFGGYQDKTVGSMGLPADAPLLKVVAIAVFGGVEVKHPASPARAVDDPVSPAVDAEVDLR